ncbi:unnamed protein product [Rodentolepis nana]|uniref:Uncharacterized protein n=1 Tax=Rodentolepis nana TaxID=102285 RepID=A0A0R3TU97_RODNA|nr:unnamed protein product [Rodentolepis nana]
MFAISWAGRLAFSVIEAPFARPGRPSKRVSIPLYLQERINLPLNSDMVLPTKIPRLEVNSNQNSDPLRGLNILQLLSLPPETVFEWLRLSYALKTGGFLNEPSIPRPDELLPNFSLAFTSHDENPSSTLFTQKNWWRQSASTLVPLNSSLNLPPFGGNEGEMSELNKPLELTTSRVMTSTSTVTNASTSDLINANDRGISTSPMCTPTQSAIETAPSASEY